MREKLKKYVSVSFLIGFSAFFIYLFFFSNLGSIVDVIGKTSIAVYTLAFICVLCGVVFDALTWHQILGQTLGENNFSPRFHFKLGRNIR